jgi:hypothetical protein
MAPSQIISDHNTDDHPRRSSQPIPRPPVHWRSAKNPIERPPPRHNGNATMPLADRICIEEKETPFTALMYQPQ